MSPSLLACHAKLPTYMAIMVVRPSGRSYGSNNLQGHTRLQQTSHCTYGKCFNSTDASSIVPLLMQNANTVVKSSVYKIAAFRVYPDCSHVIVIFLYDVHAHFHASVMSTMTAP